jgi:hypothetical protein
MPTFRKRARDQAESWDLDLAPFVLEAMLDRITGNDRRGLTRIDRAGAAGGEHAWRARVYTRSAEIHRQFADARYGGSAGALRAAVAWRDEQRAALPPAPPRPGRTWRIARAEYARLCGWLAYADRRRYFADGKYGGRDEAQRAAEGGDARVLSSPNRGIRHQPHPATGLPCRRRPSTTVAFMVFYASV